MSCFDNSMVYCPHSSSPLTYSSYMCNSRNHYLNQDSEKFLKAVNYEQFWPESGENCRSKLNSRFPPISKLRNILTDTISTITKESQLQKGESVELTLEIELMETENNSPSHSLVEVTIVQHNKKDDKINNSTTQKHTLTSNIPFQLETKSSMNETATQKRKSWFERVIGWQGMQYENQNSTKKQISVENKGLNLNNNQTNVNNNNDNNNNKSVYNPRSKFIRVLPEETPLVTDFKKGYRKVSPENKSPRAPIKLKKPKTKPRIGLVKKISNLFLPSQKAQKSKEVNTTFPVLKRELNNANKQKKVKKIKVKNKNKALVPLQSKLVNNLEEGLIDSPINTKNSKEKVDSLPLKYQSFFERISESKNAIVKKSSRKKQTLTVNTKLRRSCSDTCCVHVNYESSKVKMVKSNSISDYRVSTESSSKTNPNLQQERGDSSGRSSKKYNKAERKKHKRRHEKNAKGDAINVSRKRAKKSWRDDSKKSLIEWNGEKINVNKELKDRIEMLIVNELQNLALKEGMECDVKPLPSTESSLDNSVEKVSSFICELDISDKKFKKLHKRKESLENKRNMMTHTSKKNTEKHEPTKSKTKNTEKDIIESKTKNFKEVQLDTLEDKVKSKMSPEKKETIKDFSPDCTTNYSETTNIPTDMKITYMNRHVDSWSLESTTMKLEDSITESINSKLKGKISTIFQFGEDDLPYKKGFSSGFVKKIDSKDTTWKNFADRKIDETDFNKSEILSKQLVSVTRTKSTIKFSSSTSNEDQSTIDLELDIEGLERILQEAKKAQNCGKVLIKSVKCNPKSSREKKKQQPVLFTGKNNPAYTTQLLTNVAGKLEKYAKKKRK